MVRCWGWGSVSYKGHKEIWEGLQNYCISQLQQWLHDNMDLLKLITLYNIKYNITAHHLYLKKKANKNI